jgi:TonB family protein
MKRTLHLAITVLFSCCGVFSFAQTATPPTEQEPAPPAASSVKKPEPPASNSNTQAPTQPDTAKVGADYGLGLGKKPTAAMGPIEILTDTMGVDFGPYLQRVLHDVRMNWYNQIPESARAPLMKKGKLTIEFAIKKDGTVAGMRLVSASGDVALDRAAWAGIAVSNPFPPLPNEFGGQYIGLRFSFYYNPDRSDLDTSPTSLEVANVNEPAYFYFQEALAASNEGDYTRAIDGLKQVLALKPTYPAWNELGRIYLRQDQLDSAAAAFRKQIQINSLDPFAYNNLGLTLERQEQWEEAIKSFRSQLQINPDDRYAHANLGYLLEKRRDYANAMPELQKAISISPNSAPLLVALANAYCQSAQEEKCRSTLNQAAMIADTPENWNSLAWYMAVRNLKLDEALKYAQRAVASIATSLSGVSLDHITNQDLRNVSALASYWDTLGWVYFQRGDLPPAERYLLAAWQLRHDGVIGDHLGELYEKLGRKDDGVRYYSLSLGAANPEAGTRDRLIALAGKDAVSDEKLARYHTELAELGFLQVARAGAADAVADFYIAFVPGPGSAISDVRFICGNENLKSATDLLRSASYQVSFPDSQPVKLIRRVETVCSARDKRCSLKLLSPSVASREPIDAPGTLEILGDTMGVDFSSYVETLIKTVLPNWYKLIPQEAQAPEMKKGKVSIGFAIQKDGKLGHVDISRSSGDLELDRAAFDTILKSAPFSALPLGFARSSLSFRFHFSHNLGPDSCANGDSYPRADNSASIPAPNVGASRGGAFKVGGVVSPPRAVFAPDPEYSEEARKANYQGTAVLWVVIGPDGRVRDLRVARALGRGLDEKAMEAVKTWKFEPAMKDGKPVAVQINVEITFRLYGVVVSPTSAQLATGAKQQFSATVPGGATNSALKWSVGGSGCAASACGSISTDGLYTAPLSVPNPATVIMTATLGTDPTNMGRATVTIQPSPSP